MEIVISGSTFPEDALTRIRDAGFSVRLIPGDFTPAQVAHELRQAWGYVLGGSERMTAKEWAALPGLRIAVFLGTGWRSFMEVPPKGSELQLCYTPHANADAVAEYALGLLIASVRRFVLGAAEVSSGVWSERSTSSLLGSTLGIVGMGHVGRSLAAMFHSAFRGRVVYWNRSERAENASLPYQRLATVRDVCEAADNVVLCLAYEKGVTTELVTESDLAAIGDQGVLVNVARAELIAPHVIASSLTANRVGYVAIDGYYVEPTPAPDADPFGLLKHYPARLMVTPHAAYLSTDAASKMAAMAIENVKAVRDGRRAPFPCPR